MRKEFEVTGVRPDSRGKSQEGRGDSAGAQHRAGETRPQSGTGEGGPPSSSATRMSLD